MVNGTLSYQVTPSFHFSFRISADYPYSDNWVVIISLGETLPPTEGTLYMSVERVYKMVSVCKTALADYGDYQLHESENSGDCCAKSHVMVLGHYIDPPAMAVKVVPADQVLDSAPVVVKDLDFRVQCELVTGKRDSTECFVIRLGKGEIPRDILIFLSPARLALFTDGLERFLKKLSVKVGEL